MNTFDQIRFADLPQPLLGDLQHWVIGTHTDLDMFQADIDRAVNKGWISNTSRGQWLDLSQQQQQEIFQTLNRI